MRLIGSSVVLGQEEASPGASPCVERGCALPSVLLGNSEILYGDHYVLPGCATAGVYPDLHGSVFG